LNFFITYHPSNPTEGGHLFLNDAFSEQYHSRNFAGLIRVIYRLIPPHPHEAVD
jgi:hypothetical protein